MTTKDVCLEYIDKEIKYLGYKITEVREKARLEKWSKETEVSKLVKEIKDSITTMKYWSRSIDKKGGKK